MIVKRHLPKSKAFDDFGDVSDFTTLDDIEAMSIIEDSVTSDGFVIVSFDAGLPGKTKYRCVIYVDAKSQRSKYNEGYTNAELAEIFFTGRWQGWFSNTLAPQIRGFARRAEETIIKQSSAQVKKIRQEYNAEIRRWKKRGGFTKFIRGSIRTGAFIPNTNMFNKVTGMIDTVDEKGKQISVDPAIFYSKSKNRLLKKGWTREMESEYALAKKSEWIKKTIPRVEKLRYKDPALAWIIADPYQYGMFAKQAIIAAAKDAVERFRELIAGAKEPDIADSTKMKRYHRRTGEKVVASNEVMVKEYSVSAGKNHSAYTVREHIRHLDGAGPDIWGNEGPPLFETGMFAQSLAYKIEEIK